MPANQPIEFYEQYNLPRQFGWTPSIVEMLGGVATMDSYTPVAYARYTIEQMKDYLQRPTGRPATMQELVDYLYRVADRFGIDRNVAYRQIEQESNFNPNATSAKGAVGIAQFMPATAQQYGLVDRTDPYASLDAWGAYMRDLLGMFGSDYSKALASYNWGQGRVLTAIKNYGESWLAKAPAETRDYVARILGAGQAPSPAPGQQPVGPGSPGVPGLPPANTPEGAELRRRMGVPQGPGSPLPDVGGSNCGTFDVGCHLENFFTGDVAKDTGKRIGLVLLAVVLLAVAVVSLR